MNTEISFSPVCVFRGAKGWFLGAKDMITSHVTRVSNYFSDPEDARSALLYLA